MRPVKHCKFYAECKKPAVTVIPHTKTALCKEHFLRNIEYRVRKTIEKHHLIDF